MKRFLPLVALLLVAVGASAQTGTMFKLKSPDLPMRGTFQTEQTLNGFGCTGANVSPELSWSGAPTGTKSFALIMQDVDAKTGVGGFTHWMVYNIPASSTKLEKGAGSPDGKLMPAGTVQATNSLGAAAYAGPCPPAGDKPHRYVFTLYALGAEKLEIPAGASQAFVGFNFNGNAIAKTSFTASYGR